MANTIGDKLALAATNKTNIKQAIIDKGATVAPTNKMSQWPEAIASIQPPTTPYMTSTNGEHTPPAGEGYGPVQVSVPAFKPARACLVNFKLNPTGSTYELPSTAAEKAVLLTGAKIVVALPGFMEPLEFPIISLENVEIHLQLPCGPVAMQGTIKVHLGGNSTLSYATPSTNFTCEAGDPYDFSTYKNVTLITAKMTGTHVELARCQEWNSTATGEGNSFLLTRITNETGVHTHVGYYDAGGTFHNECKTSITVYKCPKDSGGTPLTPEPITVVDGGEGSVDIMQRLSCLSSIKMADVTFTGDSASITDNKFVRFTGPLYVKTTRETVAIPVHDASGATVSTQNLDCCVKWYSCDFADDTAATLAGYHRHPFFCRYERSGDTITETAVPYGYIARFPIKSYNLTCGGAAWAMAASKSDGSIDIGNNRDGFLAWCRANNKASVTIHVDGETDKTYAADSDSRLCSMIDLREITFMQWMAYLFFGNDSQSVLHGVNLSEGDAQAQTANGKTDYILAQGIWNGGEDPSSNIKQIVFLGVEGGIWSAPGVMYPSFTSIVERVTGVDENGTASTFTQNRFIVAFDRLDFNPGSNDEATLLTHGYRNVGFLIGSGNTRQGYDNGVVMRDSFLPSADKAMPNITIGNKDNHWQGGAPAAISNYANTTTAAAYDDTKKYSVNNVCKHQNGDGEWIEYKCIVTIATPETWNPDHWEAVIAYPVGSFCLISGKVYECNTAVEKGLTLAYVTSRWTARTSIVVKAAAYYLVAVGYYRGSGANLGAWALYAINVLSYSFGGHWRSRLSLNPLS